MRLTFSIVVAFLFIGLATACAPKAPTFQSNVIDVKDDNVSVTNEIIQKNLPTEKSLDVKDVTVSVTNEIPQKSFNENQKEDEELLPEPSALQLECNWFVCRRMGCRCEALGRCIC